MLINVPKHARISNHSLLRLNLFWQLISLWIPNFVNTAGNVRMFSPYLLCAFLIFVYYPIYFIYSNSHSAITNLYLISNFTSCTLDLHHCFNWNSPCKNSTAIYIYPQNEGSWLDQSTLLRYLFSNVNDLNKFERISVG